MAGTTESKLEYLIRSKEDVRLAIERKLIPCPEDTPFLEYGPKIKQVQDPLDTSDATATAADIRKGTSAYGATGVRLDGTLVPLDTSDATAKASDIRKGETAYSTEGVKLTGTLDPIDTSDATATAADIREGTTAYGANGTKLTGTLVPLDLSDATATAANLDKGVIAYTKDNQRIIGTGPLLNSDSEPLSLSYVQGGSIVGLKDFIPLIKDNSTKGDAGYTILFPTSKLPTDTAGKNILLRFDTRRQNYSGAKVYFATAYFCIAPNIDCHFEVRRDSSQDILRCWTADKKSRVNFHAYRYSKYLGDAANTTVVPGTIDDITSESWEDLGSVSSTGREYTTNNWYRFASHEMYNSGGLAQGSQYSDRGDDCFLKTIISSSMLGMINRSLNVRLQTGGVIVTRVPNKDVAKAIGLSGEDIMKGKTYLGISGTADIDSYIEYDDCLSLTSEILTGVPSIPYERLEYIEGTGTQYINTKVNPIAGNTSAEIDFQMTEVRSGEQWAFGQWYTDGWRCGGANGTLDTDRGFSYSSTVFTDRMIGTSTASTITSSYPMLLFCQQENGSPNYLADGYVKIYSCKIWESGVLIRHLVPVQHKSSGAIGMYDLVTRDFYENAGAGTFIAGPVIEWEG